jgi:hypothetical protein
LSLARRIQSAWKENYLSKVEKVQVTASNVQSMLFSLVTYEEASEGALPESEGQSQARLGILASFITEKETKEVLAFVTLFKTKTSRKAVAWVPLSKVKMYADLSLGLVSQQWLETYGTHESESALKLRQLQMLSWQESQIEKATSLRLSKSTKES